MGTHEFDGTGATRVPVPASACVAMRDHAPEDHKRAARMLGYALLSDTPDAWNGLSVVLLARLTVEERAKLAFAALSALDPDQRELVMGAAQRGVV
jgi:hypothetical protein